MKKIDADYNKKLPMADRNVYCGLMKCHRFIRQCVDCLYRDNCPYRDNGSMRKIKIDWNNLS